MVKTPRTRHSRTQRDPVTIELDPGSVSHTSAGSDPDEQAVTPAGSASREDDAALSGDMESGDAATIHEAEGQDPGSMDPNPRSSPETDPAQAEAAAATGPDHPGIEARGPERPADPPPPAAASGRQAGGLRLLAAGIIGGLVALVGAGLLQYAGMLGAPGGDDMSGLVAVEAEMASLGAKVAALEEQAESGGVDAELTGRVDALATRLDETAAGLAALEATVEAGGGEAAPDQAALAALEQRLAQLETAVAGLGSGEAAAPGATPEALSAMEERIAGLDALVKAASEADTAMSGRVGAVEETVSTLAARVEAQSAQPKVALAIAAAALKSAIERGVPFEAEIETFAAVAPETPALSRLREHAATGVPTRAAIAVEAKTASTAMIRAADPPRQDAGFFERLLSSAESLVTVRPIGAVAGAGVPETVARMEIAIGNGDLERAIAEFDTLPEASKAAGAALADKIRARVEVERLAGQAIASAMRA